MRAFYNISFSCPSVKEPFTTFCYSSLVADLPQGGSGDVVDVSPCDSHNQTSGTRGSSNASGVNSIATVVQYLASMGSSNQCLFFFFFFFSSCFI